jgi:hypothetical protein
MSALTASRNTPEWNGAPRFHYGVLPVEASTSIYVGGMVAIDANGYAVPAQVLGSSPLNKLLAVGVCEYVYAGGSMPPGVNALNQTGNGLLYPGATGTLGNAGAIYIGVTCSIFGMDVDSSITGAGQIGQMAFANDDHTVSVLDGSGATTVANTTSITVPSSAPLINVLHPYIQPGSFNAYSATGSSGTHYVENTDFAINYQSGLFQVLSGGAISGGGTVYITYKYGTPTKVAVGEVVAIDAGLAYVCMYKQALRAVNALATAGN